MVLRKIAVTKIAFVVRRKAIMPVSVPRLVIRILILRKRVGEVVPDPLGALGPLGALDPHRGSARSEEGAKTKTIGGHYQTVMGTEIETEREGKAVTNMTGVDLLEIEMRRE